MRVSDRLQTTLEQLGSIRPHDILISRRLVHTIEFRGYLSSKDYQLELCFNMLGRYRRQLEYRRTTPVLGLGHEQPGDLHLLACQLCGDVIRGVCCHDRIGRICHWGCAAKYAESKDEEMLRG